MLELWVALLMAVHELSSHILLLQQVLYIYTLVALETTVGLLPLVVVERHRELTLGVSTTVAMVETLDVKELLEQVQVEVPQQLSLLATRQG